MKQSEKLKKIIAIVGPTGSGKTGLSIALAKEVSGEIISADSRQVYRGLDIGTEKVIEGEMEGVPHHLIDIADVTDTYTAADFISDADTKIREIVVRGNVPIIAGGTFFYVSVLLGKQMVSDVAPDEALRAQLEEKDTEDLYGALWRLDPERAADIDKHNRRRLIRALEIAGARGSASVPPPIKRYDALVIGIETEPEMLRERINTRLQKTLEKGLVEETKKLLHGGVPSARLHEIGLEYRVVLEHLDGALTYDEMVEKLKNKLWQYAKRQMTWLKKDTDIRWFSREDSDAIKNDVRKFLGR